LANKNAFMAGSRVYLRPLERADLNERYLGWLNDPEVTKYLETGTFPTTMQELEKFYADVTTSKHQVIFAIVCAESDQHIGNVKLGPIHWLHRSATFGILIGDKESWGQGIGLEVTRLVVEYGFTRLNLHRIDLGVYADHDSALRCYEQAGFRIEGRMREALFREGEYKDRVWMGLLRSEYKPEAVQKTK
jgi:[ribosomal protein S5]-alanine N-acetyltransferase